MRFEDINLFPDAENTFLKAYICDRIRNGAPRKAVLVIPGGAYCSICDDREGYPVARQFLAAGYCTFILGYSVKPYAGEFRPIKQVALAIKYIRENAERFDIDPRYVFTIGFSAGGHLSGSAGVFWNHPEVRKVIGDAPTELCRPTGMILSYPVVTSGLKAHRRSFENLSGRGENATQAELDVFSLEKHVDETTPPAFIWHTGGDAVVPVENAFMMASALREYGVPFELHIYPGGWHGMSIATPEVSDGKDSAFYAHVRSWFPLAVEWIESIQPDSRFLPFAASV